MNFKINDYFHIIMNNVVPKLIKMVVTVICKQVIKG